MLYRQVYKPCAPLLPYVSAIILLESADAATYSLLSHTAPVLAFDYKGKVFVQAEDGGERLLVSNGIIGMHSARKVFRNDPDTGTVLVLFTETGAAPFFDFPLHELYESSASLGPFLKASVIERVEDRLAGAADDQERVAVVEQFLLQLMTGRHRPDPVIAAAAASIRAAGGNVRMTDLARELHISSSRLEKRFRSAVGASPKKYASIVRIRSAIRRRHSNSTLTSLAHDAGYFDQAHFTRDFKTFTGLTPQQFFRNDPPAFVPY